MRRFAEITVLLLALIAGPMEVMAGHESGDQADEHTLIMFSASEELVGQESSPSSNPQLELMERLRDIIDGLKSQGPAPTDCMEG